MRQDVEAAIGEALVALREAVQSGFADMAHTYSCIIERLQSLLRDL
jgi:hypothetical protein